MPCPNCGSHDLWDDFLAWGCNKCRLFSADGTVRNNPHHRDTLNGQVNWAGKPSKPIDDVNTDAQKEVK